MFCNYKRNGKDLTKMAYTPGRIKATSGKAAVEYVKAALLAWAQAQLLTLKGLAKVKHKIEVARCES
jgi:hypothetical protein